jgi:hypothetical protein
LISFLGFLPEALDLGLRKGPDLLVTIGVNVRHGVLNVVRVVA